MDNLITIHNFEIIVTLIRIIAIVWGIFAKESVKVKVFKQRKKNKRLFS